MKKFLLVCFSFVFVLSAWAQERVVSGKVTAQEDASALPGVNVVLKGTTNGTVTDADGNYKLNIPAAGGALVYSFIGLQTSEILIGDRSVIDVALGLDIQQLTEVVVTAQGIEREQKSLGYAQTTISSGLLANKPESQAALLFYVITYAVTVLGAFGVVAVVEEATGSDSIENFTGLSRRAPVLSLCLLVFLLSLAGIPPLAGFIGKFFVFSAVVDADAKHLGLLWLVILAIAMSAVSFYYYLRVLKAVYVTDGTKGTDTIKVSVVTLVALVLLAALVVFLGCGPGWLMDLLRMAPVAGH